MENIFDERLQTAMKKLAIGLAALALGGCAQREAAAPPQDTVARVVLPAPSPSVAAKPSAKPTMAASLPPVQPQVIEHVDPDKTKKLIALTFDACQTKKAGALRRQSHQDFARYQNSGDLAFRRALDGSASRHHARIGEGATFRVG